MRNHHEQPVRAPRRPHRSQWLHAEDVVNIGHPRPRLVGDRFGTIGMVIRHHALAPFEQAPHLRQVRVLLRPVPMRRHRVVITTQAVVGIDEHQRARVDCDHRLVEPALAPHGARRTVARGEVGETQNPVEAQRALGQRTARSKTSDRTIAAVHHFAKAVVEVGIERPEVFSRSARRIEIAHVLAVGVVILVGHPEPHHAELVRRQERRRSCQPTQQAKLQEVSDITCVSILHDGSSAPPTQY